MFFCFFFFLVEFLNILFGPGKYLKMIFSPVASFSQSISPFRFISTPFIQHITNFQDFVLPCPIRCSCVQSVNLSADFSLFSRHTVLPCPISELVSRFFLKKSGSPADMPAGASFFPKKSGSPSDMPAGGCSPPPGGAHLLPGGRFWAGVGRQNERKCWKGCQILRSRNSLPATSGSFRKWARPRSSEPPIHTRRGPR